MTLSKHVGVRLSDDLLARVDALGPGLSTPWYRASRSDILRAVIVAGLPVLEARTPAPSKPATKRGGKRGT
jgi:hypothetical protein